MVREFAADAMMEIRQKWARQNEHTMGGCVEDLNATFTKFIGKCWHDHFQDNEEVFKEPCLVGDCNHGEWQYISHNPKISALRIRNDQIILVGVLQYKDKYTCNIAFAQKDKFPQSVIANIAEFLW